MFYKFVGGDADTLLQVFDRAVAEGSLKLGAAWAFNDPFEFKFRSVPPSSRESFDAWHRTNAPTRTPAELNNAWASFEGPTATWNTEFLPRVEALKQFFVLCLTQRWDSHLMWGHYADAHRGFVIHYKPELRAALEALPGHVGHGQITYGDEPPSLRWFGDDHLRDMAAILATKPRDWAYEQEYRFVHQGPENLHSLVVHVDPQLVAGVILGARAPAALVRKACQLRELRPDLLVEQVTTNSRTYALLAEIVADKSQPSAQIL